MENLFGSRIIGLDRQPVKQQIAPDKGLETLAERYFQSESEESISYQPPMLPWHLGLPPAAPLGHASPASPSLLFQSS